MMRFVAVLACWSARGLAGPRKMAVHEALEAVTALGHGSGSGARKHLFKDLTKFKPMRWLCLAGSAFFE